MTFFHSTEFYIILFIAAAAIVAFAAIPHGHGAVREFLLGARLVGDDEPVSDALLPSGRIGHPAIEVVCRDDGEVSLIRHGLQGVDSDGAVSAKVEVNGFNVTVYERIAPRQRQSNVSTTSDAFAEPVSTAVFTLDFLASDRYYLRYESELSSSSATLAFRNIPGYHPRPAELKQ